VPADCSDDKEVWGHHGPVATSKSLISQPIHTHPNARLTAVSRERLVRRHIKDAEPLGDLAAQAGIRLRTSYKWLARYRSDGPALP